MIETKSLLFQYSGGNKMAFPDFNCAAQEILLILGSSGAGKSTLLHLLGGLLKAGSGHIIIGGKDITTLDKKGLDAFRGENIGIIFQKNHFVQSISVLENLLLTQYLGGRKESKDRCKSLLDRLQVGHKANVLVNTLSEGEKQRVAIARSLVNKPKLILADEPTSALDDTNCEKVVNLLLEQAKSEDAALIIVTHDARLKDIISNQVILSI